MISNYLGLLVGVRAITLIIAHRRHVQTRRSAKPCLSEGFFDGVEPNRNVSFSDEVAKKSDEGSIGVGIGPSMNYNRK